MEARTHESSAEMRGDGRRVLDALVISLAPAGFRVERRSASEVELAMPPQIGSIHSALHGASRVVARAANGRLVVRAELGGVEQFRRFFLLMPITMLGVVVILIGVLVPVLSRDKLAEKGWIAFAPTVPIFVMLLFFVFVLRPFVTRRLDARVRTALDALTTSVATIGADG